MNYQASTQEQVELRQAFAVLDANRDNKVDRGEMLAYLEQKDVEIAHRTEVVEEIFRKCDQDHNGYIDLDEFVKYYLDTKNQLMQRNMEQENKIITLNKEITSITSQLVAQKNGGQAGKPSLQCKITQIDLEHGNFAQPGEYTIQITHGHFVQSSEPQSLTQGYPYIRFNHTFLFAVDQNQVLNIKIVNKLAPQPIFDKTMSVADLNTQIQSGISKGDTRISLSQLETQPGPRFTASIELIMANSQNLQLIKENKENEMRNECQRKAQIEQYLSEIAKPFGCLNRAINSATTAITRHDQEDQDQEKNGDNRFSQQEQKLSNNLDKWATAQAQKRGLQNVPWAQITKITLLVYMVVTCFSCYYRPDFMSLTAIAMGIYAVECPNFFRRWVFRLLVCFITFTFVFDFIHLIFLHDSREDDEADCEMTKNVRRFSYFFAWISFLIRPVVIVVFWKDSLDFMKIIKNQSSEKQDVLSAMNMYGRQGNIL